MSVNLSILAEARTSYSGKGIDNLFKSGHMANFGIASSVDVRFAIRIFPKGIESLFQARHVFFRLF